MNHCAGGFVCNLNASLSDFEAVISKMKKNKQHVMLSADNCLLKTVLHFFARCLATRDIITQFVLDEVI